MVAFSELPKPPSPSSHLISITKTLLSFRKLGGGCAGRNWSEDQIYAFELAYSILTPYRRLQHRGPIHREESAVGVQRERGTGFQEEPCLGRLLKVELGGGRAGWEEGHPALWEEEVSTGPKKPGSRKLELSAVAASVHLITSNMLRCPDGGCVATPSWPRGPGWGGAFPSIMRVTATPLKNIASFFNQSLR